MSSEEILQYYRATAQREVREDLVFAVSKVTEEKTALDCGCGAGADIAFLRKQGFIVNAFDIEEEAIRQCKKRFETDEQKQRHPHCDVGPGRRQTSDQPQVDAAALAKARHRSEKYDGRRGEGVEDDASQQQVGRGHPPAAAGGGE